MDFLMVTCILVIVGVVGVAIVRHLEKKNFNRGICPICNGKLHNFDTDSQGGRGYICDNCGDTPPGYHIMLIIIILSKISSSTSILKLSYLFIEKTFIYLFLHMNFLI